MGSVMVLQKGVQLWKRVVVTGLQLVLGVELLEDEIEVVEMNGVVHDVDVLIDGVSVVDGVV